MITHSSRSRRSSVSTLASSIVPLPENSGSEFNENRLSAGSVDFGSAVLNYSCDDRSCHLTRSEFELVDFDLLSR